MFFFWQVLEHGWMSNGSSTVLSAAQASMRKYNASRKLKKAANKLIAAQRMAKVAGAMSKAKVA